jgi:hypothetical protein
MTEFVRSSDSGVGYSGALQAKQLKFLKVIFEPSFITES